MKVGFHSPLPPAKTGVAAYSAVLLAALRRLGEVEVGASDATVHLYHLGNNHRHAGAYWRALERPGVVVLHDAVLNHFFLGALNQAQYLEEFVFNYGPWSAELARLLWSERARSAADPRFFRYGMLKRIAESSRAVIVHNPAAARMVREHAPGATIHEIPHFFVPPALPPAYEIERLRTRLGCNGTTLLCGVFGHLRESKRLGAILRVFDRLRGALNVKLMLAGECASADLERSLANLRGTKGVIRTGYLSEPDFWLYASAADVGLNLRCPAAGETSGIGIRLMGIGKPVITSDGPEISRLPLDTCLRAATGAPEEDMVAAWLVWLAQDREGARQIGSRARDWIAREHALAAVARSYWEVLSCYSEA